MSRMIISAAPEYFSFYAAGSRSATIALQVNDPGIQSNGRCIRIPCLYWNDGDTTIVVGSIDDVELPRDPEFDGWLETPVREVMLYDANNPRLGAFPVADARTRIRIWINHPSEPDEVVIGVG